MNIGSKIKNNIGMILAIIFFAIIFLNADAKTYFIKGLIKTGLYKASIPETKISDESIRMIPKGMSFVNNSGTVINLDEQKGKVVFMNFWATWCPPCRAEMPSIKSLYEQTKNKDVVFIMVDVDSKLEASEKYMKKHDYQLPVFAAASSIPREIFNINLPTTLIIDKSGRIVYHHAGMASYDSPEMVEFMNELLKN